MSLVATAKANGIEPHVWLTDILRRLPTTTVGDRRRQGLGFGDIARGLGAAPAVTLVVLGKYSLEAGFGRPPDALAGKPWNDLARRQTPVLQQVAGGYDGFFLVTQGVRTRAWRTFALVLQAFGTAPVTYGATGAEHLTSLPSARAGCHRFIDQNTTDSEIKRPRRRPR